MPDGMWSSHWFTSIKSFALRAKIWARVFPWRFVCEKEDQPKEETKVFVSSIKCPYGVRHGAVFFRAEIIVLLSPSKITQSRHKCRASWTASFAARASTTSTDAGSAIFLKTVATGVPWWLQVMIPRPTVFWFANIAPSKFALKTPSGGGDHLTGVIGIIGDGEGLMLAQVRFLNSLCSWSICWCLTICFHHYKPLLKGSVLLSTCEFNANGILAYDIVEELLGGKL